ncbi:MAG: hypothetical protein ABI679_03770 [Gemmatimonadota bacterium]
MKYFHRTTISPASIMERATTYFGKRLTPTEESSRDREYSGNIGRIRLHVGSEGGHYTVVTISTDQPAESEADKFAKRFLTMVHTMAEPTHAPRGAY